MANKEKKMNKGIIAGICAAVVVVIVAIVAVIVVNLVKPGIVGKYTLAAVIDSNGNESTETVEFMKALGVNYTIEFKDDGTGILNTGMDANSLNNEDATDDTEDAEADKDTESDSDSDNNNEASASTTKFTYANNKMIAENANGVFEADYEYKDGAIILTIAGETMKFTRI